MPAHRSITAWIHKRILLAEARRRSPVYELFREPKLIPECALHRPNQVHFGSLRFLDVERFTYLSLVAVSLHPFSSTRVAQLCQLFLQQYLFTIPAQKSANNPGSRGGLVWSPRTPSSFGV